MRKPYTHKMSDEDAQKILEKIMHRKNWTAGTRDELSEALQRIVARQH